MLISMNAFEDWCDNMTRFIFSLEIKGITTLEKKPLVLTNHRSFQIRPYLIITFKVVVAFYKLNMAFRIIRFVVYIIELLSFCHLSGTI